MHTISHAYPILSDHLIRQRKEPGRRYAQFSPFFSLLPRPERLSSSIHTLHKIPNTNILSFSHTFLCRYYAGHLNARARCLSRCAAAPRSVNSQKFFIHSLRYSTLTGAHRARYFRSLDLLSMLSALRLTWCTQPRYRSHSSMPGVSFSFALGNHVPEGQLLGSRLILLPSLQHNPPLAMARAFRTTQAFG